MIVLPAPPSSAAALTSYVRLRALAEEHGLAAEVLRLRGQSAQEQQ